MRKMHQGILGIIIGFAFLMSFWILSNYFLVGGVQEVVIEGTEHTLIITPHPISIQYSLPISLSLEASA
jgi:hypothetical protein